MKNTTTYNREEYVLQHGSESLLRLFWRKALGRLQRSLPFASLRRMCAGLMGVNVHHSGSERPLWIGLEVYLDDSFPELITLEEGAVLGVRCSIICHDDARRLLAPVLIGKKSYIGAGAIILPGVTIGEGVIIGAGAVVTKDVPSNETWHGVPARKAGTSKE